MGCLLNGVGLCLMLIVISIIISRSTTSSMSISGHPSVSAENNTNQQLYNNGTNSADGIFIVGEEEEDHEYLNADHEKGKQVVRGLATYHQTTRVISYGVFQRPQVCDANIYGDCIERYNPHHRPCTYYTRCSRNRYRRSIS
ncbi:hypothetical protein I3842_Q056200 [Carya illinoinensis]|uniref:Uncharacterized protein n=1 Tax=Carya illinoinensis TaxID=32201 RepID=A0A922D342_CARIL|nr:hypothetical protein I3842_Q056200 [Carya illinoinensis]